MSGTIAQLGLEVDSSQAATAATDLDKLTQAGVKAEKAAEDVAASFKKTAASADDLAAAEVKAAQATDDAKTRLLETAKASLEASQYYQSLTAGVKSNTSAMDAGRASTANYVDLQKRLQSMSDALIGSTDEVAAATKQAAAATGVQTEGLEKLLGKISPAQAALKKLDDQLDELKKHRDSGVIGEDEFKTYSADIDAARQRIKGLSDDTSKFGLNSKGARENVLQLGNALAEGNFRVAAHNLLEIGANAGTSALRLAALIAPFAAVAAVVGVLSVAYYKGAQEADAFNKSLILTGSYAGLSATQLSEMAKQVSAIVGTTGAAAEALAALAGNGKIASSAFLEITEAAVSMKEATGKAISETIAEFVKIADDPVKASEALNQQYHYLTASVYAQIVALEEQGNHAGAVKLATEQFADAINDRTPKILENLSIWEKAYNAVAKAADSLKNIGRPDIDADIEQAQKNLDDAKNGDVGLFQNKQVMIDYYDNKLNMLRDEKAAKADIAKYDGEQAKIQEDGIGAARRIKAANDSNLTPLEKRNKLQKEYLADVEKLRKANANDPAVSPKAVAQGLSNIAEKNKDAKPAAAGAVDLTAFNTAQNQLKSIISYYQNAQKELEAAQKAGLITAESYSSQRVAIVEQEKGDITSAYESEIAALEAVRGKTSTSAVQRIQLDQKIADARTSMVKAQQDADSQLEVLATAETGRLAKQKLAISNYTDALDQQNLALQRAGQRAVVGLGQGDRQASLTSSINGIEDKANQQRLDLARDKADASRNMSAEEYIAKLTAINQSEADLKDTTLSNYEQMSVAQGDWRSGATSAWQNYLESARDAAGQTKSLFTNAFSSMGDAIANFATTGKFKFSDFSKSIISDMARIASQQASSALLSTLVGAATSYFAGGAGGATASATAGGAQAGASNFASQFDASSATVAFPQAKGGAWRDGVQMFANGGAFTNSVVSTPTAFGMANGRTGVMGEAGDEAIMPLARTAGGQLGVRALSSGGGSSISISAPVTVVTEDRSSKGMQLDQAALTQNLQTQMKAAAEKAVADSWRGGGVSFRNSRGRA
ncbi:MAG TPA: phage tail tape measure protein [Pseudomonas sp.]|jgi:lambda family phage tail tape measure protein